MKFDFVSTPRSLFPARLKRNSSYRGPEEPWAEKYRISDPPAGERRPSARKWQRRRGSCCTTPRSRDAARGTWLCPLPDTSAIGSSTWRSCRNPWMRNRKAILAQIGLLVAPSRKSRSIVVPDVTGDHDHPINIFIIARSSPPCVISWFIDSVITISPCAADPCSLFTHCTLEFLPVCPTVTAAVSLAAFFWFNRECSFTKWIIF